MLGTHFDDFIYENDFILVLSGCTTAAITDDREDNACTGSLSVATGTDSYNI